MVCLSCFDEFTARFIRAKVRQLIRFCGFSRSDYESLVQDFVLNLIRRSDKFDSNKATWDGFVIVTCENHSANLLEHCGAEMRSRKREDGSLNRPIADTEGNWTDFAASITASQHERRTGRYCRSAEEEWELRQDIQSVLADMPPRMRSVCERLMTGSKTSAAAELNMSRSEIYEMQVRILNRFDKANLREYLA